MNKNDCKIHALTLQAYYYNKQLYEQLIYSNAFLFAMRLIQVYFFRKMRNNNSKLLICHMLLNDSI